MRRLAGSGRRTLAIDGIDVAGTLRVHRCGAHDPTTRIGPREAWRATAEALGPATLHVCWGGGQLEATAWGPGAEAALDRLPDLVGLHDDPRALVPRHEAVAAALRRHHGLRCSRSGAVWQALVPAIVGQRVTSYESIRQWTALCRHLSEPAPGPPALLLPPTADAVAAQPSWWFHRFGIERRRADTFRRAARRARSLERLSSQPPDEARRLLRTVPGIGVWTAAKTVEASHGDPDAVAFGDYHLPHVVSWALAGEPRGDDARMLELLAPYAGQRGRVVSLLLAAGWHAPRLGPRRPIQPIAAL